MNVLSLFDGISCGKVALERAGVKIDKYYASEIDKYANIISEKNHKDIIRLGDVTNWKNWNIDFSSIDLLIGGSPCQGFSMAGKLQNFDDPRSKLFFEFVDILNCIKKLNPNVKFLLENVKMKKEWQDTITKYIGVEPILIDSALVSAQRRKRLYWTNISNEIKQPKDKGILLKDIVLENTDLKEFEVKDAWINWFKRRNDNKQNKHRAIINSRDSSGKAATCLARQITNWSGNYIFENLEKYIIPYDDTLTLLEREVSTGKIAYIGSGGQGERIYSINNKSVSLCGLGGGRGAKTGLYLFGCITPSRIIKRQNGGRFNDGNKFYTLTSTDKHGILTNGYIRKLTPIEAERLQTLPDNYTNGVSNTQRYKMLGNGWTVDVIAHIFSYL